LIALIANIVHAKAFDVAGVWTPVKRDSVVERIHISGSPLDYIATIDYRCATAICSTFQSLIADPAHSETFSVPLGGIGPAPMLALRWQKGPPCNRAGSDENPLAFWTAASHVPSGRQQAGAAGRVMCLVRPPPPPHQRR
jgi:hypothetical protein